jgi:DNA mismatch repair protein MutL
MEMPAVSARIRILPEQLANKIAAGEVVERPASVLKELLENALDAAATEITVEVEGGGKRLIRVTDNGSGMSREDALLALERHATSKIVSDADLFALSTLGFRGEALPSIASVSRLTLASRQQGALAGTEIYLEGGTVRSVQECGMPPGTVVTVRNLFFNTPARLKFLKSTETESGHLGDVVVRLALSRPDVRMTFRSDGRSVVRTSPETLRERAASLLGKGVAAELYAVEFSHGGLTVSGLASRPELNRATASHFYTFINGRFIRDRVVQHAILAAYRNLLERGRYPVVVLQISLPADEVDVNVHPTKHEVRFRKQPLVHDTIRNALEEMLRRSPWQTVALSSPVPSASATVGKGGLSADVPPVAVAEPALPYSRAFRSLPPRPWEGAAVDAPSAAAPSSGEGVHGASPGHLRILGQLAASYLVCDADGDLVLIDQHAAHERVAYERLRSQFRQGGLESQGLLFPETMDLNHRELAAARSSRDELATLGFSFEEFGGTTIQLTAAPRLCAASEVRPLFLDILSELQEYGRSSSLQEQVDGLLATIACHSVVRGAAHLGDLEIRALLAAMDETGFAANCPHGRPVVVRIDRQRIGKMFGRT